VPAATLRARALLKSSLRGMSTVHTPLAARGFLDPETEAVPLRTHVEIRSMLPSRSHVIGSRIGVLGVGIGTCGCLVSGETQLQLRGVTCVFVGHPAHLFA